MSYAIDGKCHNAEPNTYGHECGKPAVFVGETRTGFRAGYCADCRRNGHEARECVSWQPYVMTHEIALTVNRKHTNELGHIDEGAMCKLFNYYNLEASDRIAIWRSLTNKD